MYEKILLATMGEYMDQIIEHAKSILNDKPVEIIGIYVIDTSVPFLTPKKVKEMMVTELKGKGVEILNSLKQEFQTNYPSVRFQGILVEGNPAEEIVKVAERENVDLIILGTGKNIVDKKLLGSVSEKVVHSSPSSILLVRTVKDN